MSLKLWLQVYYGMNLLQQFIIRRISASLFAMGTALRLVASIAGTHTLTLTPTFAACTLPCHSGVGISISCWQTRPRLKWFPRNPCEPPKTPCEACTALPCD